MSRQFYLPSIYDYLDGLDMRPMVRATLRDVAIVFLYALGILVVFVVVHSVYNLFL